MVAFSLPRGTWKKSNVNYDKCVQDTSRPQKLPCHLRSVLKASSAGHTGKFGLQRGSDADKPQGGQTLMSKV